MTEDKIDDVPEWVRELDDLLGRHIHSARDFEVTAQPNEDEPDAWDLVYWPSLYIYTAEDGEEIPDYDSYFCVSAKEVIQLLDPSPTPLIGGNSEGLCIMGGFRDNKVHVHIHTIPIEEAVPVGTIDDEGVVIDFSPEEREEYALAFDEDDADAGPVPVPPEELN